MTSRRWPRLAVALSAGLLLAGCTQSSAGTPLPDGTSTASIEPDTTTSTEPSSERPREIDLNGKDPCAIPQTDWPKFDIERPGKPSDHPDFHSPNCYYSGDRAGSLTLVVTAGIEEWTTDKYNAEIEDAEPIDGFPTITVASNVDRWACLAVVDVADGQFLMTTTATDPDDPNSPERCDLAYQLAESAMKTLAAS